MIIISPKTKTVWHKNPISGHEWPTNEPVKGFEVSGGHFFTSSHSILTGAQQEVTVRESLERRFYDKRD